MEQTRARRVLAAGIAVLAMAAAAAPAPAQESVELNAFSVWQGQGQIVEIGRGKAALTGVFSGVLFVETDEGPIDTGVIACPMVVHIDLESGRQEGKGYCTFTARDGARLYSEFACEGVHLVGCRGDFRVTGGTDRLEKVAGGGSILVRGRAHELAKKPGALVETESVGIAVWRDLKLTGH